MTVTGQPTVNYNYDNANRLTSIVKGSETVSFGYDDANRPTSLTLPNGVTTEYGYDNASQLTSITYKKGAATLGNLSYGYDEVGRRNAVGGSLARTLVPPTLSLAHTYNALNQLKQRGAATLNYDNEGNLTSDGTTNYTWNARGELTGMTRTGLTASFAYDAFGRRISKTVNGVTTKFLYDGGDAVQEQNASGAPTANMLVGGTDTVFSRTEGASTRTFQHDGLGSAIGLLDQNGATTTSYAYEPFGATAQSGAMSNNASKYTGREDDGTGLYYYRARYYSPTLQRFISEDPIGFAGGDINLYAYVQNNPISYNDPSGQIPVPLITGAVGAGIGAIAGGGFALLNGESWSNVGRDAAIGAVAGGVTGLTLGFAGPALAGLAGGGIAGGAFSGAVAGGVGNAAGQGVGVMFGRQCNFSWRQMGFAAALGGLGGGLALRPYTAPNQTVTSWAGSGTMPRLSSGRWVMTGGSTSRNWALSGSPELGYPISNCVTGTVPASRLAYPPGLEAVKGLFGQRVIQ